MTAIVLPDIDRSTIEELRKRIPDLSEIDLRNLPSRKEVSRTARDVSRTAKEVSKNADETIDRLLGRKRAPVFWPWIAAGIGLVAIAGVVGAWFAWFRRPAWQSTVEPWTEAGSVVERTTVTTPTEPMFDEAGIGGAADDATRSTPATGKAVTNPLGSAPYPIEEA